MKPGRAPSDHGGPASLVTRYVLCIWTEPSLPDADLIGAAAFAALRGLAGSPDAIPGAPLALLARDELGDAAVVVVLGRRADGSLTRTSVLLRRGGSGRWESPQAMNTGRWPEEAQHRPKDTWEGWESPVLDPAIEGWALGSASGVSASRGWKWATGVAALDVVAVEVSSPHQTRSARPDADSGVFVVLVAAAWEEALQITAVHRDGRRRKVAI